jgi:predicted nucleic acid-binding protein
MRIVVTDACIFIDVIDLQLTAKFFGLELEIHTTVDVFNELYPNQQQILQAYQQSEKLIIHILSSEEQIEIQEENFPASLSPEDRSVIFMARKLDAIVLSSDKPVRNHAKKLAIDYHGMIWVFDQLVEQELLAKPEAIAKLQRLVLSNMIYKGNADMIMEMEKRVKAWSKE